MSKLIGSTYTASLSDKITSFTSSGTFTASVSSIDYLVVAGGAAGAGTFYSGGGGGKKGKKIRKHQGILQTGGNAGRLKKGYRYSGQKLKSGLPQIIKCKSLRNYIHKRNADY